MKRRIGVGVTFGCFALIVLGCADRAGPAKAKPTDEGKAPANAADVTIYVEGMSERQGIT